MAKYFLHNTPTSGSSIYWREASTFANVLIHINLNMLALAVGDIPSGANLVSPSNYNTGINGISTISLQPFVKIDSGVQTELAIGNNLTDFLNNPLENGRKMELSLPVYDRGLNIGNDGGGWFRNLDTIKSFHFGFDICPRTQTNNADLFDVCAAQEGKIFAVEARKNSPVVISHEIGGKVFLTVYQHLDLSQTSLFVGRDVKRGEFLAKITDEKEIPSPLEPHFRHLHFMVAVEAKCFTLSRSTIPKQWYAIDPFGIYDYYNNRKSNNYNYLKDVPPNCFDSQIRGAVHTIQWINEPLSTTIPIMRETDYKKITRFQIRVRKDNQTQGMPPAEHNQSLVWLEGESDYFFVPMNSQDNSLELKMIDLLKDAFNNNKHVKLEYFFQGSYKIIAAVWINA